MLKIYRSYRYKLSLELRTYAKRDVGQLLNRVNGPRILQIYSRRKHGSHGEESGGRVSYGNGGEGSVTEKETGEGVGRRPDVEFGHCDLGSSSWS